MRSLSGVIGVVGAALLAAGCAGETACTQAGFYYGLIVSAEAGERLPDGNYRLAILADGSDLSFDLPVLRGELCPPGTALRCESVAPHIEGGEIRARVESSHPSGFELHLTVTEGERLSGPAQVSVQISLDGAAVGDGAFTPSYQQDEANGGCDVFDRATGELPLTLP